MSFAKVYSAQVNLLSGQIVTIEVDLSRGLHAFSIVGLPDKAVDESKDRVSSAIKNSGFGSPKAKNQKIIVSLSPADLKKEGPFFDLAIALSYMLASGDIKFNPEKKIFFGELGLDGTLRRIRGALPLVQEAKRKGFEEIYLPKENAVEAALVDGIKIFGAENLNEVVEHLVSEEISKVSSGPRISGAPYPGQTISLRTLCISNLFFLNNIINRPVCHLFCPGEQLMLERRRLFLF